MIRDINENIETVYFKHFQDEGYRLVAVNETTHEKHVYNLYPFETIELNDISKNFAFYDGEFWVEE